MKRTILLVSALFSAVGMADADPWQAALDDIERQARKKGVSEPTLEAIDYLRSQSPRQEVKESQENQPEVKWSLDNYLEMLVSDTRVADGRYLMHEQQAAMNEVEQTYRVPRRYLTSLLGLETNYGQITGDHPALHSLASLASEGRRKDYFAAEAVALLQLADREGWAAETIMGSWAGALGNAQVMPWGQLAYGKDLSGDGFDPWAMDDALATAAVFLTRRGWQPDQRWGREVMLQEGADHACDFDGAQSLASWQAAGVRMPDGSALPEGELEAKLYCPQSSERRWLLYPNADVLYRWNRSWVYVIAVGELADRLQQPLL